MGSRHAAAALLCASMFTLCLGAHPAIESETCCDNPAQSPCERIGSTSPVAVAALIRRVTHGEPLALDLALASRASLDGGSLEDLDRALAGVAERRPRVFLNAARVHCLSGDQVASIVTMLPLETVDQTTLRASMLRRRIQRLSSVGAQSLVRLRDAAVSALSEYLASL